MPYAMRRLSVEQGKHCGGDVSRRSRRHCLIGNHPEVALFATEPDHRLDKVATFTARAGNTEQRSDTENEGISLGAQHQVFAHAFRCAIDVERRFAVIFRQRLSFRLAAENIIGRNVNQSRAFLRAKPCQGLR